MTFYNTYIKGDAKKLQLIICFKIIMHKNFLQDKKRLQSIKIRFHKNLSCKTNSINNEFHKTIILKADSY